MYDRTTVRPTVQGATFSMRGQLYHGHYFIISPLHGHGEVANENPLITTHFIHSRGFSFVEEKCGKKMRVTLLGLPKSIYYFSLLVFSSCLLFPSLLRLSTVGFFTLLTPKIWLFILPSLEILSWSLTGVRGLIFTCFFQFGKDSRSQIQLSSVVYLAHLKEKDSQTTIQFLFPVIKS